MARWSRRLERSRATKSHGVRFSEEGSADGPWKRARTDARGRGSREMTRRCAALRGLNTSRNLGTD
eukprot:8143052-Pyramimonas_sp.AAC.1